MYGIPANLDLSDIIGSVLQQIRIGRFDVQFHFASGREICLQSRAEISKEGEVISLWNENSGWSTTAFFLALNTPISAYAVPDDYTLEICFEGNISLRMYDESAHYESMQIQPEGIII